MRENFKPTLLRAFGGLVTFIDRVALALGLSPQCRNARFAPGMVASRDGYQILQTDGGEPITGMAQLVRGNGQRHLLTITEGGRLKAEYPDGTLTTLMDGLPSGPRMVSASLFSKKYICLSDGKLGVAPLCRYDGSVFRMVGAGAPGKAPTIAQSATAATGSNGLQAGWHSCVVIFVNVYGDVSGWSPIASVEFTASDKKTAVTAPLGPTDTAQRIIAISLVNDAQNFKYTAKMVINENTTATAITLDISEEELVQSQLSARRWISSFVPWAPAGCTAYQERLLTWGSLATLQPVFAFDPVSSLYVLQNIGFWNLAFDGGFTGAIPNGWGSAGAGHAVGGGVAGDPFYSKCYRITGDAASTTRGTLTQFIRNNSDYLRPQARYGVAIFMRSPVATPGSVHVKLNGAIGGDFLDAAFACGQEADGGWVMYTYEMPTPLAVDEISMSASVYWSHSAGMGVGAYVDLKVAIYNADENQHLHTLYASDSGRPGTFVGATCVMTVGPDDGEGIRTVFRLRDALFVAKERSLHGLMSTSSGEPSTWGVGLVDALSGTPSAHGVDADNSGAIIANRDGALLFDGASIVQLSDDIEALWRGADWTSGHRAVVVVDRAKKVVRFALPQAGDTYGASLLLTLDYKEGWGTAVSGGSGRKWGIDTVISRSNTANAVAQVTAGMRFLSSAGTNIPILSIYGEQATNSVDPVDFSDPTWTFPDETPVVTTGLDDGRGGTDATRWAFAAGAGEFIGRFTIPALAAGSPVVSTRVKPSVAVTLTITTSAGASYAQALAANVWTRVSCVFTSATAPDGAILALQFSAAGSFYLASFQIDANVAGGDWGFTGSAPTGQPARSALIVTPVDDLRRDFAGRIRFLYETAPFGDEVGRSTFDTCIVRARGNGMLKASYTGTGTRTWTMIQTQLTATPDEDLEFGGNLIAPAATLVLECEDDEGWVVINRLAVANKGESIGSVRGRNG